MYWFLYQKKLMKLEKCSIHTNNKAGFEELQVQVHVFDKHFLFFSMLENEVRKVLQTARLMFS